MAETYRDLVIRAETELKKEKEDIAVETLKERIKEIEAMEVVLAKTKNQYQELLDKPVKDILLPEL